MGRHSFIVAAPTEWNKLPLKKKKKKKKKKEEKKHQLLNILTKSELRSYFFCIYSQMCFVRRKILMKQLLNK